MKGDFTRTIMVEDIEVLVSWKRVKNLNMRIKPPGGQVYLSVPLGIDEARVRDFVLSRLGWIRKHQEKIAKRQHKELLFKEGEDHYFLGRPYKLIVKEDVKRGLTLVDDAMLLRLKEDSPSNRRALVEDFYREELRRLAQELVPSWEEKMGVSVKELGIRKMTTRWGSCNTSVGRVWLSLELAKYEPQVTEYVLVHEMVHLQERGHNKRFYRLMDLYLPDWRQKKKRLSY
ncbi:MAG: M48 family metallopeptidase [Tissierellia bacterium]|nr:M48 family metallopeptidase [Tissierellia bacterium]